MFLLSIYQNNTEKVIGLFDNYRLAFDAYRKRSAFSQTDNYHIRQMTINEIRDESIFESECTCMLCGIKPMYFFPLYKKIEEYKKRAYVS